MDYPGIRVTSIQVQPTQGQPNTFNTFWQESDVNLSRGLDFGTNFSALFNFDYSFFNEKFHFISFDIVPRGNVFARFTHLNHQQFSYNINVTNNTGTAARGTCRIFMAPQRDERNTPMLFRDQREMMIELDKFTVACTYKSVLTKIE